MKTVVLVEVFSVTLLSLFVLKRDSQFLPMKSVSGRTDRKMGFEF